MYKGKHDHPMGSINDGVTPEFATETGMESVVSRFKAGASMKDGVSGKKKIDTTFENNRSVGNIHPRSSDISGDPPNG